MSERVLEAMKEDTVRIILFDSSSGYTIQYWKHVEKNISNVDITVIANESSKDLYKDAGEYYYNKTIFYSNKRFCKIISLGINLLKLEKYDIAHTLWIDKFWGIYALLIRIKSKKWLASIGGSDLYRYSSRISTKKWQEKVLKFASGYSSENTSTREYFYEVYGDELKNRIHNINRYGVDIIDELRAINDDESESIREKWGISREKVVVMLGHNARVEHQHREMIEAISNMSLQDREKCFFIIPMTYPSGVDEYIHEVDDMMKICTSQYQILTEYMDVREMAEITRCSDVMIHVQTTDQLSSTMMAHMYDENIVIAGSWLPYSDIRNAGIEFYDVDDISDITALLTDIVENFSTYKEKMKNNRENVYKFSSWEYAAKAWYNTYIELLEESKK